jgi:hypothetical protein
MHRSNGPQAERTKTDRAVRRRIRRWKSRARLAAPFLALPSMLGLLILSVDLIEYQPGEAAKPAHPRSAADARRAETGLQAIAVDPQSVSALSVVGSPAIGSDVLGASVVGSATPIAATMPSGSPLSTGMAHGVTSDAALFADPTPMPLSPSPADYEDGAILEPTSGTRDVR